MPLGYTATFFVTASGTEPFTYQWKKGDSLVGTNSASLCLENVQPGDQASYSVTVSNSAGSSTSQTVTLSITDRSMANSLSKDGLTWLFDKTHEVGQFANGDFWVLGPVSIIGISNNYHVHGYSPVQGQDGSMINPGTDTRQGYDHSLSSYVADLNVSHPNNQAISTSNPLHLAVNQSLVSAVSWLFSYDKANKILHWAEPGCPTINGGTGTPRPVLRVATLLSCLAAAPPEGSFRPPYAGQDKTVRFNINQLQTDLLGSLSPVGIDGIPDIQTMEEMFRRVWLDHVNDYLGSYVHPSENMPDYGREIAKQIGDAALLLNLNFTELPEWGLRHATNPYIDDKDWNAIYRDINGVGYPGFVLAAHIMDQKQAWNHDALFDYMDRWWAITGGVHGVQKTTIFTISMWNQFREGYGEVWQP
jgi:hypothetical protein